MAGKVKRKQSDESTKQPAPPGLSHAKPTKIPRSLPLSPQGLSVGTVSAMPTAQKSPPEDEASKAGKCNASVEVDVAEPTAEEETEWRTEGSAYVGRGILRTVVDDDGQLGEGWGKITGWLSADESDFVNEQGNPAALWHVVFDDASLGEEDLEEHEVKAAVIAWELATRKITRGGKKKSKGGSTVNKRETCNKEGDSGPVPPPANDPRVYFVEDGDGDKGLPELARELNVEVEEIIRLNCERYKGLKNASTCRLKPHTVLILPPITHPGKTSYSEGKTSNAGRVKSNPLGLPSRHPNMEDSSLLQNPATEPAAGVTMRATSPVPPTSPVQGSLGGDSAADPRSTPSAAAPPSAPSAAPPCSAPPSIDAKTALLLLQNERNGLPTSNTVGNVSHDDTMDTTKDSSAGCESGARTSNWLMAMRPSLIFPPFPGVTEDMGAISREYVSHFYCPFVKKQGITYAATGYEAIAPVTAEVDDNWAECDACKKWRRLPGTFVVSDGAAFLCGDAHRRCEESEDEWNDEDELEIENERGAVLISALQNLNIEGLQVLNLGRIELSKGYWSDKHIFPVGFRSRRSYLDTDTTPATSSNDKPESSGSSTEGGGGGDKLIQYECLVEMGDDGPIFSVTPVGADGELLVDRRSQADTTTKAWSSIVMAAAARLEGGGANPDSNFKVSSDAPPTSKLRQTPTDLVAVSAHDSAGKTQGEGDAACVGQDANGEINNKKENGHWERDEEGNRSWVSNADPLVLGGVEVEMRERSEVDGGGEGAEGGGGGRRKPINGNVLFGLANEKVKELIKQLDGAEDITRSMDRWARRRQGGSLEERLLGMPAHLWLQQNKNVRVPLRNVKTRKYLHGDDAPRVKDIKKFLIEHTDVECYDPSDFNRADAVMLEEYCKGLKLCYDCKMGNFAHKSPSKFECRFKMLHTGPAWKKDPRTKSDDKDPLAHIRHTSKFKTDYPAGTILKLDFNKAGEPSLLRMPREFVQDALQVQIEWDDVLDEEGFPQKQARLLKMEAPRCERKVFTRPPWPPQLPEIEEGCARSAPRRVQSFTVKAEFTHHAKQEFKRLISAVDYKAMNDSDRFLWMKRTQNSRLILGRSGIEGYGIFARQPIYKGEMVVEYTGERVRPVVADVREEQYENLGLGTYFWRLEDYLGAGEPPEGRASIVDATIRHNIGHYINHCCDPNCKASIVRINGQRKIIIAAEYDIQFGEEITYDYKLPLESADKKIPCLCGAFICKGTMN